MSFPENLDEMRQQGYKFDNEARCRYCGTAIEWWITPTGKKIPMDVDGDGNVVAHFGSCSEK